MLAGFLSTVLHKLGQDQSTYTPTPRPSKKGGEKKRKKIKGKQKFSPALSLYYCTVKTKIQVC